MKYNSTFKLIASLVIITASSVTLSHAQALTENFDNIANLASSGWVIQNNSNPVGGTSWYQGVDIAGGGPLDSYNGATTSYVAANYNSTGGNIITPGKISNWLITPVFNLRNGDTVKFFTTTYAAEVGADRLQLRMSTNGASVNVGTTFNSVGDFTTLLQDINPNLALPPSGYPTVWTQYTSIISGLSAPTSGRIAFRYFVNNAGLYGTNSDYIGIDNFIYRPYICPTLSISPTTIPNGSPGVALSQSLSQTGALGTATYSLSGGALPTGLAFSSSGVISGTPSAGGSYNFNITVSDASACTSTQSFVMNIACASGTAALSSITPVCSNSTPFTLSGGSPAGGTYSGTGITAGVFDPSVGTQTVVYTVGSGSCVSTASTAITVNSAPSVSANTTASSVCAGNSVTLSGSGASSYSWDNSVTDGVAFSPSSTATYIVTGTSNGCSATASTTITINQLPTVTATHSLTPVCAGSNETLTGGGASSYIWDNGVTNGVSFAANSTLTYNVVGTDANGCTNSASTTVTVLPLTTAPVAIIGNDTICSGGSQTYSVAADINATSYTWTLPSGWSGTSTTNSITASSITSAGTITVTADNSCGSSTAQSLTIFFGNPPAQPSSMLGVTHLCDSSSTAYAVTLDPNATGYTWTLPSGWSGTSNTNTITATASTSNGVITVTADNACGSSTPTTLTVFASTIPTVTVSPFAVVCESVGPFSLSGGSPAGGSYSGVGVNSNIFDPATSGLGTYMITYTYANGACVRSDSATITVDLCLGINNNTSEEEINIYPNPASNGMVTIHISNADNKELIASIIDMQGREVYSSVEKNITADFNKQISLEGISKGIYFIKINNGAHTNVQKLIIE